MEKKQKPPKRKFKEIYAEQRERIKNKEKLPKEKRKKILAGAFAVIYIIISLFLLFGNSFSAFASSESSQNSLGYATVPYNALIFNTGDTVKYKQYDYPNTNIRESDTFYNSLTKPTGGTVELLTFWECCFQTQSISSYQQEEIKALSNNATNITYTASTGRAMINTSDPINLPEWETFSEFYVNISANWDGSIYMSIQGNGRGIRTLWDSVSGWVDNSPNIFYIPEFTSEDVESELYGDGWEFIKIIATLNIWKSEMIVEGGTNSDIEWELEDINTDITGAVQSVHSLNIGNPNSILNNNALSLNIIGSDFVISNSIIDRNLLPYLHITEGKSPNMKISIAVQVSFEYVLKTALDNGTTQYEIKQGIAIETYQYNSTTNTAYEKSVPMFIDFRDKLELITGFTNTPEYYVITDTDCNIQITGIDESSIPKITISNTYGWSGGNGTRATMDNFLTREIGNFRTGEEVPILPEGSFMSWLGTTLDGFFNTDIVGIFSLGDILWVAIGIGALFATLKYFAGG